MNKKQAGQQTKTIPPKTIIVHCSYANTQLRGEKALAIEIEGLARAIDLDPLTLVSVHLKKRHSATFIGSGKVKEIQEIIRTHEAALVIFNAPLSPTQQQALEKLWQVKILDRTGLILEIFGKRARTKEARLQTDLAQLAYQKGRLVRSWTHLERQRGGAGFMGGPGERQIESDRRQISMRITSLKQQLEAVRRRRQQMRNARKKAAWPIIALVGYTNAGKSTLFNRLTGAHRAARNRLFDTLDPNMRLLKLPDGTKAILSDTVGFISDLPHDLIAAFRATLEEIAAADIILHLRDFSHADSLAQKHDVEMILKDLHQGQPIIEVLNKIDIAPAQPSRQTLAISAKTGAGVDDLCTHLQELLAKQTTTQRFSICLKSAQLEAQDFLYKRGRVLDHVYHESGARLEVLLPEVALGVFRKKFSDVELTRTPR